MKLNIKSSLFLGLVVMLGLGSCKKDNISLENSFPDVPVTVANKYETFTAPTVKTSLSGGGAIQIILSIPASSGRTIKEITKVAAGTAYSSIQATTGLYVATAQAGTNTNTITFNTTLAEYTTKTGLAAPTAAVAGTTTAAILARSFYFMITLDNGQVIVPTYVRVYVDK